MSTTGRAPCGFAGNNHALDSPCRVLERTGDMDKRAREVARESILVEEYGAAALGNHVKVLRQGTVSDKARLLVRKSHATGR